MNGKRLFVTPRNDGETVAIIEMLERNGEQFLITGQAWGASWDGLEDEIKEKIEQAKQDGIEVIGVELQGDSHGATNIDHHVYGEDNRSNIKASVEQVADKIGVQLTVEEQFIAANDKGYIPAMEKLGQELGMASSDLETIIPDVRMKDRMAQGITLEQEEQAKVAIEQLGDLTKKRDFIEVNLPHSKTATVTDRLYGKYDELLIISGDGETNFFGSTDTIQMLNEKFPGGWSGGQLDQGNGFWGGYVDQDALRKAVRENMAKKYGHQNVYDLVKERLCMGPDSLEILQEKAQRISVLSGVIGEEVSRTLQLNMSVSELEETALITRTVHPDNEGIYNGKEPFDPAKNAARGDYSLKVATESGIELNDAQKSVVKGKSGLIEERIIKIVETIVAVQYKRMQRGTEKDAITESRGIMDELLNDDRIDKELINIIGEKELEEIIEGERKTLDRRHTDEKTFENASRLEPIVLPKRVKNIGEEAPGNNGGRRGSDFSH